MLLLRSDHLLRGSFTDGFGKTLAGDAVPRGQQPVVDRLSRHTVPLSVVAANSSYVHNVTDSPTINERARSREKVSTLSGASPYTAIGDTSATNTTRESKGSRSS